MYDFVYSRYRIQHWANAEPIYVLTGYVASEWMTELDPVTLDAGFAWRLWRSLMWIIQVTQVTWSKQLSRPYHLPQSEAWPREAVRPRPDGLAKSRLAVGKMVRMSRTINFFADRNSRSGHDPLLFWNNIRLLFVTLWVTASIARTCFLSLEWFFKLK